jgi:hypothetical protein
VLPLGDVQVVDGLHLGVAFADRGERLLHGHLGRQAQVLAGHQPARAVRRVGQQLAHLGGVLRGTGVELREQDLCLFRRRLGDHLRRVVHRQVVEQLGHPARRGVACQVVRQVGVQLIEHLGRAGRVQRVEDRQRFGRGELLHRQGDVGGVATFQRGGERRRFGVAAVGRQAQRGPQPLDEALLVVGDGHGLSSRGRGGPPSSRGTTVAPRIISWEKAPDSARGSRRAAR